MKMNLISVLKNSFIIAKNKLNDDSYDSLLWIINYVPDLAGFSVKKDKISVWFWCFHWPILIYVYGVSSFVFQWKYAKEPGDYIKTFYNVFIFVLIASISWWFLKYRLLLKSVLEKISQNDEMSRKNVQLQPKHKYLLKIVKRIVVTFYGLNFMNLFFIHLPNRVNVTDSYSVAPCVGLEPLTESPNYEICVTILVTQEFFNVIVVLNYQALFLLLIAHTAIMYQMLSYEMINLNKTKDYPGNNALAKKTLPVLIKRHSLTLEVIDQLKLLYSVPIGVNFGSNAVCICLFFYIPVNQWLQFIPVLMYCFLVFFLYCVLGQRLINASEFFERSVYCCGWENFDLNEKRLVFVMLRQAQKPVELLAADIIPVNIYTFATTLQAMFKFVTVVKL